MSTETNKALARRLYEAFVDRLDEAAADELLDAAVVVHGPAAFGTATGRQAVSQGFRQFLSAFGDRHTDVDDLIAEDDKIVARHTHHMTHGDNLWGIPATGKQLTVSGIDIFRFTDGKIIEWWVQDDSLGMLQQLGVNPAPGQTSA